MEHDLRTHLLACAQAYALAKKLSSATTGRLAAGDWRFFERLQHDTTTFTARKYDEVLAWFSRNWPDDLAWPADVLRPDVTQSAPVPAATEAAPC